MEQITPSLNLSFLCNPEILRFFLFRLTFFFRSEKNENVKDPFKWILGVFHKMRAKKMMILGIISIEWAYSKKHQNIRGLWVWIKNLKCNKDKLE